MKYREIECKSCGADLKVDTKIKKGYCDYCGSQYLVLDATPIHIHKYKKFRMTPAKAVFAVALIVIIILSIALPIAITNYNKNAIEPSKPYVYEDPRAYRFAGNYLVGTDIEQGEYVVYCDPLERSALVYINKTEKASENSINNLFFQNFSNRVFVKVTDGQYLRVIRGNIFKLDAIKIEQDENGGYPIGVRLKVGLDIPAGEYIIADEEEKINYHIYSDWNTKSPLTSYVDVYNRRYIKLNEGEYVASSGGKIYPLDKAPTFAKDENGDYTAGQYKVGVDIEEGTYQIIYPQTMKYIYYGILYDSPLFTYEQLKNVYLGGSNPVTSFELKSYEHEGSITYDSCYVYVHNDTTLRKIG